jgi:methyl-accepting chemotaxis protein
MASANSTPPARLDTSLQIEKSELMDLRGQLAAIHRAQAVIEFGLDGVVITANENFLSLLGYRLEEIKGQHHSMFVDAAARSTLEYRQFWADLGRGNYRSAEYKRITKSGKPVWIQASYNPVFDDNGKPYKVVKFATDVSEQKRKSSDYQGQIDAIGRVQAVIEFELDGTIVTANDNFLRTLGYRLDEIQGKHHSMFVEPSFRATAEYQKFWAELAAGKFQAVRFKPSARAAARCGSRLPTIRSPIWTANRSRSSSTRPTSPKRSSKSKSTCDLPASPRTTRSA